jgi:hypothetical protein
MWKQSQTEQTRRWAISVETNMFLEKTTHPKYSIGKEERTERKIGKEKTKT